MVVATCNGALLVETDGKLGVVERGGGWVGTALFVAGLLTLIAFSSGIGLLATGYIVAGITPLGMGVLAGWITVLLFRRRQRDKAMTTLPAPWLVFDVPAGVVRNAAGAEIGKLDQVKVVKEGQVTSSSSMLVAYCPAKIVLARGNPFGDSIDGFKNALKSRGIG